MTYWQITHCSPIGFGMDELLADGWEPFSVTSDQLEKIWLRRPVERHEARVIPEPREAPPPARVVSDEEYARLENRRGAYG
jgi:hypothetical protein